MVHSDRATKSPPSAHELLTTYLRDHRGGAAAGLALVQRCRSSNAGTELADVLRGIETEIIEDTQSLELIMARFAVTPSRLKIAAAKVGEVVGRLKSNGRLFTYSPSSRVLELELLAAGIVTKCSLWRALNAVASSHPELLASELDELEARATAQYETVMLEHAKAATRAFSEH
jgi:hypothetical protein